MSTELLLHLHEGINPIYSSESVSAVVMNVYDWKQGRSELSMEMELKFPLLVSLIDSVKKEGFHVKPILTYRRFYEWVPSYYQQRICHLPTFSQLLDNPNPDCRISLRSWVVRVPNCTDFPDYFTDNHPLLKVSKGLKYVFGTDEYIVMNMHQSNTEDKGEILASFVRQVLPDSKN